MRNALRGAEASPKRSKGFKNSDLCWKMPRKKSVVDNEQCRDNRQPVERSFADKKKNGLAN